MPMFRLPLFVSTLLLLCGPRSTSHVFHAFAAETRASTVIALSSEEEQEDLTVRILKEAADNLCGGGAKKGDWLHATLRVYAPGFGAAELHTEGAEEEEGTAIGTAEQEFMLGTHSVAPLNVSLYGICPGEVRRIGLRIGSLPHKIFYVSHSRQNLVAILSGSLGGLFQTVPISLCSGSDLTLCEKTKLMKPHEAAAAQLATTVATACFPHNAAPPC
ncbi:hypothetical protein cyc_05187 [Cyclospora cayetanensis]|uniref:Uncharacterized protein n=1 Tax=Cyclospora cayetanensis TaxID=88456 RepID=A0A1D3CVT6_9EIME|nr:hypothetical protein cyc_05187 [Cyclospora cayetanensis]